MGIYSQARLFCLFTDVFFILSTIPCGDDQRLVQLNTDNQLKIMIKKIEDDNLWLFHAVAWA
jgi:hypothetical protein